MAKRNVSKWKPRFLEKDLQTCYMAWLSKAEKVSLKELSERFGLSRWTISRKINKWLRKEGMYDAT